MVIGLSSIHNFIYWSFGNTFLYHICYSLSSERLVDIKVTKFYLEEGVASAGKI
jgi:hypothetical protein